MFALTFGWFDIVIPILLGLGFWRGRHNGASNEHIPVIQWFLMCLAGAILSGPLGGLMYKWLGLSQFSSQIFGYLLGASAVFIVFVVLNSFDISQVLDGNFFGKGEPHVGGVLGMVKFILILMVPLAIIHGRKFNEAQINNTLHGKLYASVFQQSLSGSAISKVGSFLLIDPAAHTAATKARSIGAQKNKAMDAASAE
jgi:hypothetical protein